MNWSPHFLYIFTHIRNFLRPDKQPRIRSQQPGRIRPPSVPLMEHCIILYRTGSSLGGEHFLALIDLKKLKYSMNHQVSESEGWMRTEFNGGRSKLERKKGFREWWSYRQCLCPNGKHLSVFYFMYLPQLFRSFLVFEIVFFEITKKH